MPDYYLSLDAGTSGGKAVVLDDRGYVIGYSKTAWNHLYFIPEDLDPYGSEFKPEQFWDILLQTANEAILNSKISSRDITAITATSQRHGCVFFDDKGIPLYAGPNRDARGLEVDTEEIMPNEELYEITGHGLPFLFALTRLLWFKENEEDVYDKIKHLLSIDGWVNFRLTGNYTIDDTAAAETLLFDIKHRKWSDKILSEFEIPHEILPEKYEYGKVIGTITPAIASLLDLNSNTPVVMNAADTQASILGCGGIKENTLGIVAGSTMPLQMIIDKPIIDSEQKIWTGAFPNNLWVLESNAGSVGDIHKWFIDSILTPLGVENPYDKFESLVLTKPPGSGGVIANLGPQVFSSQAMLSVPIYGGFSFTPIAYSFDTPVNIAGFSRSVVENIAFAARANYDQILAISGKQATETLLMGGVARSKVLCQILANVLNCEIKTFLPEGASVSGAFAAMIGTEKYSNLEEVVQIISDFSIYYPQQDQFDEYEALYPEWKAQYQKSFEED